MKRTPAVTLEQQYHSRTCCSVVFRFNFWRIQTRVQKQTPCHSLNPKSKPLGCESDFSRRSTVGDTHVEELPFPGVATRQKRVAIMRRFSFADCCVRGWRLAPMTKWWHSCGRGIIQRREYLPGFWSGNTRERYDTRERGFKGLVQT